MKALVVVSVWALVTIGVRAGLETYPEQVHLAYGSTPDEMTVTWVTLDPAPIAVVEYGITNLNMFTKGNTTTFVDGGPMHRKIFMHKVTLTNLIPGQRYTYHCGSPIGWSDLFYFTAMPQGTNWSPRLAVYGDLGNVNPQSLPRLQQETQRGMYDAVLHVGDFAYNMDTENGMVGDAFMRQVESIAAYIPYMTCVGNHESAYNFSNYKARFAMPRANGDGENIFYSFDLGPAHIIAFSTEVFFYTQYGTKQIDNMMAWLKQDLLKANLPMKRMQRPWVIAMGHRPMYCSNNDHDDCTTFSSKTRHYLEDLFYEQGVDLQLWAHEHSYERLWPIYNYTVCNGTSAPFTNPPAPVHVITGSAGMYAGHDHFKPQQRPWTAFRTEDYGYSRVTIHNTTHLSLEQVSDDQNGKVVDNILLIKESHGPGLFTCHMKPPQKPPVVEKRPPKFTWEDKSLLDSIRAWKGNKL